MLNSTHNIINGHMDLPDNMMIGKPCIHGHIVNGHTVRYIKHADCIDCARERVRKHRHDHRDMTALETFEALQEAKDFNNDYNC